MNPTALKEASRVGFPADPDRRRVVERRRGGRHPRRQGGGRLHRRGIPSLGCGLPGHPGDPRPRCMAPARVISRLSALGRSTTTAESIAGILSVEAIRVAQGKYGNQAAHRRSRFAGASRTWTSPRSASRSLGAEGLMSPHQGNLRRPRGRRRGQVPAVERERLGRRSADWIATDKSIVDPMIQASSSRSTPTEKGITPRSGMSMDSDCG